MTATVTENTAEQRFELALDGGAIAAAYYQANGDRLTLTHTEVPPEFAGQGIGKKLATGVFDLARQSGRKLILQCSFMADFYERHPEYADIVAN